MPSRRTCRRPIRTARSACVRTARMRFSPTCSSSRRRSARLGTRDAPLAIMRSTTRRRIPRPRPTIVDVEPEDTPLIFDEGELDTVTDDAELEPTPKDTGLLYGVHELPAEETELAAPEDNDAFRGADLGESFVEALAEKSIEYGPRPEHELDIIDETDLRDPPPSTDHRDRPKADRGSGGPGG